MSESLLEYCEHRANNKVEVELNLEVEVELLGKVRHEVKAVVQVHGIEVDRTGVQVEP